MEAQSEAVLCHCNFRHNQKAFRSCLLWVLHSKLLHVLDMQLEALKKWTIPCSQAVVIGRISDLTRSKSGLLLENAV